MIEAIKSLFSLRWTSQPFYHPLPAHIKRTFVRTTSGDLELLVCEPTNPHHATTTSSNHNKSSVSSPPIFFIHGGCGSATVWLDWMSYLHAQNYPAPMYAYSLRNHGGSYSVPFLRMVWRVSLDELAGDLVACIEAAKSRSDGAEPVLVAHSAGGGLSQYILSRSLVHVRALCLVAAVPYYGMLDVYSNWARHDPWFLLRSLLHLQHPMSPLSSPRLVHAAFFSSQFPLSRVSDFMLQMPPYESMWWPTGMMGSMVAWIRGAQRRWLDPRDILRSIGLVATTTQEYDTICIMGASSDVLMDAQISTKSAAGYRNAMTDLKEEKKADSSGSASSRTNTATTPVVTNIKNTAGKVTENKGIPGVNVERENGVRFNMVDGAGQHLQNDLQLEAAADALRHFVEQVV